VATLGRFVGFTAEAEDLAGLRFDLATDLVGRPFGCPPALPLVFQRSKLRYRLQEPVSNLAGERCRAMPAGRVGWAHLRTTVVPGR
jgi:hypothetical protein